MRAMLSNRVDSDHTYSYTDRQVVNLFQFALWTGVLMGGMSVALVMRLVGV